MKRYTLQAIKQDAGTTMLTLRPSNPAARMEFRAGQYVALGFKRFGRRTPMRCFSLTNAPNSAGELQLAFRRQGDFTRALAELAAGDTVFVAGPFGSFTVQSDQQYPLVYLAAGIGITPFMSLLRSQVQRGSQAPTTLLYSCRTLEDAAFAAELIQLSREHTWLTVRFLVNQVPGSFHGHPLVEPGRVSADILTRYGHEDADYYVCGSAGYNKQALALLEAQGIADEQINTEAFGQSSKLGIAGFAVQKLVYSLVAIALLIGIGGVFSLDSLKARQKTAAITSSTVPAASTTDPSASSSSTSTDNSTSTGSNAGSSQTAPTQTMYYRQPMSSVS